jgi:hypothetical protein
VRGIEESDWPRIKQLVADVHDERGRAVANRFSVTIEQDPAWSGTPSECCMRLATDAGSRRAE